MWITCCICHSQFPAVEQGASNVDVLQLPNHVARSDGHHTSRVKSSLYAGDTSSFSQSHQSAVYQTDSATPDVANTTTTGSCSRLDADAVSSNCDSYGRDAFMMSEPVLSALEMGFDHEMVRNVVHLKMVQSGRTWLLLFCDWNKVANLLTYWMFVTVKKV